MRSHVHQDQRRKPDNTQRNNILSKCELEEVNYFPLGTQDQQASYMH
jgi:hypothetical protein